jgi:orotate phosphoribosyltransferase
MTDNAIRNEIGGAVAQLLFESGAIHVSRQQPFILAAGWASPVYVDVRIVLGDPALRQAVTQLAVRYVTTMLPQASIDGSPAQRPPAFPLRHGLRTS